MKGEHVLHGRQHAAFVFKRKTSPTAFVPMPDDVQPIDLVNSFRMACRLFSETFSTLKVISHKLHLPNLADMMGCLPLPRRGVPRKVKIKHLQAIVKLVPPIFTTLEVFLAS